MPVAWIQSDFRGRNDNGGEIGATWIAAANTDWTQASNAPFRVRFVIQETGGASASGQGFQLQYNRNSAGWVDVTASSSVVKSFGSTNIVDGQDTTQQVGGGTFVTPNAGVDEVDGAVGSATFAGSDETELELCIKIITADIVNNDTIQLRIVEADLTALGTYSNTPSITVSKTTDWETISRGYSVRQSGVVVNQLWVWSMQCPECDTPSACETDFEALPSGTTTVPVYCSSCDGTFPSSFDAPT